MDDTAGATLPEAEALAFATKVTQFRSQLSDREMVIFDRVLWASAGKHTQAEVAGYDDGGYNALDFLIRAFTGTSGSAQSYPYANVPVDWPNAQSAGLLALDQDPILE